MTSHNTFVWFLLRTSTFHPATIVHVLSIILSILLLSFATCQTGIVVALCRAHLVVVDILAVAVGLDFLTLVFQILLLHFHVCLEEIGHVDGIGTLRSVTGGARRFTWTQGKLDQVLRVKGRLGGVFVVVVVISLTLLSANLNQGRTRKVLDGVSNQPSVVVVFVFEFTRSGIVTFHGHSLGHQTSSDTRRSWDALGRNHLVGRRDDSQGGQDEGSEQHGG
jgi:hypothetical protein